MIENITGTHIHYYMLCKRKLWLSLHYINLENLSSDVQIGKLIEENTFTRRSNKNKQIQIENIKIDYIDFNKKILYETKKSSNNINSAIMQMKYYLFTLNDNNFTGIIEIPSERMKEKVVLSEEDKLKFQTIITDIKNIYISKCPQKLNNKLCKKCSFYEFCYC